MWSVESGVWSFDSSYSAVSDVRLTIFVKVSELAERQRGQEAQSLLQPALYDLRADNIRPYKCRLNSKSVGAGVPTARDTL